MSSAHQAHTAASSAGVAWVVRHGVRRALAGAMAATVGLSVLALEVVCLIPSFAGGGTFRYTTR